MSEIELTEILECQKRFDAAATQMERLFIALDADLSRLKQKLDDLSEELGKDAR